MKNSEKKPTNGRRNTLREAHRLDGRSPAHHNSAVNGYLKLMIDISQIVRNILLDLGISEVNVPAAQCGHHVKAEVTCEAELPPQTPQVPNVQETDVTELRLCSRLITFADIRHKLSGIRKIIVPKRSIITPLVRDELRAKKISIEES
ncbi:MAG: hypothetical protein ACRC2T_13840 [Thermoguttaceae bacterium]